MYLPKSTEARGDRRQDPKVEAVADARQRGGTRVRCRPTPAGLVARTAVRLNLGGTRPARLEEVQQHRSIFTGKFRMSASYPYRTGMILEESPRGGLYSEGLAGSHIGP